MRILMVASEVAPFAKTGGLADVVGALSKELVRKGHDVRIIMPLYRNIEEQGLRLIPLLEGIKVDWGLNSYTGDVMRTLLPGGEEVPVYFLRQSALFGREGLYGESGSDYPDNDLRFAFFCFASLWAMKGLHWKPDIIHLHDWQAALVAPLLKFHPLLATDSFFFKSRTVLTIHNLAYQGIFDADLIQNSQLPWNLLSEKGMEYYGKISLLKGGIVFSDRLTTVSPTYADEIQSSENGMGMDGMLRSRANELDGILNGIDTAVWNPEADPYIPAQYSLESMSGKKKCRTALLKEFGLKATVKEPVLAIVSRLVSQKGLDLVERIMPQLCEMPLRFLILGTGAKEFEKSFTSLARKFPKSLGVRIGYDEKLAHLIEAGADIFVMPSHFEPSGLNQLYSMRYGTLPIVRHVGGLADSVINADEMSISDGTATGFSFLEYTPDRLLEEVRRAVDLFRNAPKTWNAIMRNAMERDSSWRRSAAAYEEVYRRVSGVKRV